MIHTNETSLSEQIAELKRIALQGSLAQKAVLTLPEAALFTGRSTSNLYKLSSQGRISCSKPEGKMLYFDRLKLEEWMLRNPIRTNEDIEREAVSRTAFSQGKVKKRKDAA
jgi:predicted DNA-binding transcriptional regulator AlpA